MDLESKIKALEAQLEELKKQLPVKPEKAAFVIMCRNNKKELSSEEIEDVFKELEKEFTNWYTAMFSVLSASKPYDKVRKTLEDTFNKPINEEFK